MKSKAPLALMEQLIMLMVFALAAALCLQVYVLSDQISNRCEARDQAVTQVQNAAETVKICKGDLSHCSELMGGSVQEDVWQLMFDASWQPADPDYAQYRITAERMDSGSPLLGTARICAQTRTGEELFSVNVSWQEGYHE